MRRRALVAALPALGLALPGRALPPARLQFPRDFGAHPDFRTEWWYVTGHARSQAREFGFQVTFFRSRVDAAQPLQSRFAAKQLVFAHAALTDVQGRKLWHDQRIAREGFGVALAAPGDTELRLRDWTLQRRADGYHARLAASDFALELRFAPTQPVLLQGEAGLSRKGPQPRQASYYYSQPQLAVTGAVTLRGQRQAVDGRAWLDHEWSEELLHPEAVGWDWIGINLDDGGALTAFRLRRQDGSALWAGGSVRGRDGSVRVFGPGEVAFTPLRRWTSPLSQAAYPVEWSVRTPAGTFGVKAVLDDQELDSRASTGAIYWEGLSDLLDAGGRRIGRGYLELTGYAQRLRL
ncbi:carotenoid 1,2-hydratase [Ramlibacter sp.]|uniref:lipocalin-like domain-containing protein n=1 Tax=Ramlibacter sp. TaxID=1917967 RepID=UPI002C5BE002|nr:carotenoid 1,2-hydratase [Ramlibacter sp.]HWI81029.1 carotenoid 1,2-hydratase [Ramlibacter sp.]